MFQGETNQDKILKLQERIKMMDINASTSHIQPSNLSSSGGLEKHQKLELLNSYLDNKPSYLDNKQSSYLDNKQSSLSLNMFKSNSMSQVLKEEKDQHFVSHHDKNVFANNSFMSGKNQDSHQQMNEKEIRQSYSAQHQSNQNLLPLQGKFLHVEEKLNQKISQEHKILQNLEMQISLLQDQIRNIKKNIDKNHTQNHQKFEHFQRNTIEEIQQELEDLKNMKKELTSSIEKKYKAIKTETMAIISEEFDKEFTQKYQNISTCTLGLKNRIEQEQQSRDEVVDFMINSFGDEILKLEQSIGKEKNLRIQKNNLLMVNIAKIQEQLLSAIAQDKKEMINGINILEGMLEDVCYKIQANLLK